MMRTLKTALLIAATVLLIPSITLAQESKNQALYIHEDLVKPSMIQEYEQVSKEFAEVCKKHQIQEVSWVVASTTTGRYLNVSPIENMAELDKNVFAPLKEKMGEEAFGAIFKRFNACYDRHRDFVVYRNNELTYMPEDTSTPPEGENYRKWHFLYVTPSNIQSLKGKLKELKALFAKKGSKHYYSVYHSGFGTMGDYYVAVTSAKDAEDYAKKSKENQTLLGEEGKKLFDEVFDYVLEYEEEVGGMHPELGYSPIK